VIAREKDGPKELKMNEPPSALRLRAVHHLLTAFKSSEVGVEARTLRQATKSGRWKRTSGQVDRKKNKKNKKKKQNSDMWNPKKNKKQWRGGKEWEGGGKGGGGGGGGEAIPCISYQVQVQVQAHDQ